jgi:hypothetical protein
MLQSAASSGFNPSTPLYISAVPLHQADVNWPSITMAFGPYAQKLLHKELYLSEQELVGLDDQQLELVDLLVLAQAEAYVGLGSSLASVFVREYRHLHNLGNRNSSRLASETSALLASCATFQ